MGEVVKIRQARPDDKGPLLQGRLSRGSRSATRASSGMNASARLKGSYSALKRWLRYWARLDAFEGEGYERVVTAARLEDGTVVKAHIFALKASGPQPSPADESSGPFARTPMRTTLSMHAMNELVSQ